jgi:hypothetical protein
LNSLGRKEGCVVGILRSGLRLENNGHTFLYLLENIWKDKSKKCAQLLKVILQRRPGQKESEKGRNLDQALISLRVDVL